MFNFTPLLGAQTASGAIQSLLELEGGVKLLIDVGWDDGFSVAQLTELESHVPSISLILLTHATKEHIGAFAHCCKHIPLFSRIPVYATHPVISLGRTLLQDLYSNSPLAASVVPQEELAESGYCKPETSDSPNILLKPPTPEEIASYFTNIHPLKYSQPHQPIPTAGSPPLNGLTIVAYSAGHSLGGTIWHIQHGLESIVYAVDWNQTREHVASGAAWLDGPGGSGSEVIEHLRQPTALICSARGSERLAISGGRKKRDDLLVSHVRATLQQGGTVLIPSDSSARALELAYVLERAAKADASKPEGSVVMPLHRQKIVMASSTCSSTLLYARSMLEWMDENMAREFEAANAAHDVQERKGNFKNHQQNNKADQKLVTAPFDFRFVKVLEQRWQLKKLIEKPCPKVILASDSSLEWGYSRDALTRLAADPMTKVILTDRAMYSSEGPSLSRVLWDAYSRTALRTNSGVSDMMQVVNLNEEFTVKSARAEPLSDTESELYNQIVARRKEAADTLLDPLSQALDGGPVVEVDDAGSDFDESDDSDDEQQGKAMNVTATMNHARNRQPTEANMGVNILLKSYGKYDFNVRGKRGREKMFPFVSKRSRVDEYGDVIRAEDYLRAEEKEEDVQAVPKKRPAGAAELGSLKRRWDGDENDSDSDDERRGEGNMKRHKVNGQSAQTSNGADSLFSDDDEQPEESEDDFYYTNRGEHRPSKVVISEETIRISVSVAFVDYSGRHDKRSLYMLIPLIRPQKLILVGGEKDETESLAEDCRKLSLIHAADRRQSTLVYTPENGTRVDASVDTHSWMVRLSQQLVKRLQWQRVAGIGVVALSAMLVPGLKLDDGPAATADQGPEVDEEAAKKRAVNGDAAAGLKRMLAGIAPALDKAKANFPVLDLVQSSKGAASAWAGKQAHGGGGAGADNELSRPASRPRLPLGNAAVVVVPPPLHVGDLRLAELRRLMHGNGYSAEFRGDGVLLINGSVIVRKSGPGRVEIENVMCSGLGFGAPAGGADAMRAFYEIRKKIYDGLAVVDGAA